MKRRFLLEILIVALLLSFASAQDAASFEKTHHSQKALEWLDCHRLRTSGSTSLFVLHLR
jgi:hypothetical protein